MVLTGGAGFLGFHLSEILLGRGDEVVCVDNLISGTRSNVDALSRHDGFEFLLQDASVPYEVAGPVDAVMHFASPASVPDYLANPLETLRVGSNGTFNALDLARAHDARFLVASTSEIYGEPLVHPQPESYWGNVNPNGPRSVYDEAKRFAEAVTAAYRRTYGTDTSIVRFFNTYGPRMRPDDGRVVSNFVLQALKGEPLTVYGDGLQTRSYCYVNDLARGIVALLDSDVNEPVNLGNPVEHTVIYLAQMVRDMVGSGSVIDHRPLPEHDPTRRRPDITRATELLGWSPSVSLEDGLAATIEHFRACT